MKCKSDREDIKLRKRHKRVGRKWKNLKPKCQCCPDCFEPLVGLNDRFDHVIRRFYVECENCHWCAESMPTIRLAIWAWNRQKSPSAELYDENTLLT